MFEIILPGLNFNRSNYRTLFNQTAKCVQSVGSALAVVRKYPPMRRDYPLEADFIEVTRQHDARCASLRGVYAEFDVTLMLLRKHIDLL